MSAIEVRNAHVTYGSHTVLSNLDLDVAEGEFVVLLGASGCGKSTLLNAIAGLIDLTDGEIWIGGRNVTWAEPHERGIGMVFQSYALYPRMTVKGNMSFGLKMARVPRAEIARRVARAAEVLKIGNLLERRPAELSGGQRQRVAIGRALVRDVDVFLFDEPLSNLDAKLRSELRVEIKRLHRELANTVIYVTHDQIEALTLADRVAVMSQGVIQQLDRPEVVYSTPANRFVAGFIGSPSMNFVPGMLEIVDGRACFRGGDALVNLDGYSFRTGPEQGRTVELGVRPEHVKIGKEAETQSFHGEVVIDLTEPMGADTLLWTSVGGQPFAARVGSETSPRSGARASLGFSPEHISLFDVKSGQRL
jgi:multiple sugar transport system ATP-binding protein